MSLKLLAGIAFVLNVLAPVLALSDAEMAYFVPRTHIERNTNTQGLVSVRVDPEDDAVLILKSNGVPDHATADFSGRSSPNALVEKNFEWRIPKTPAEAATTSCLPQGPIAMAINGVPIFNAYSRTCCDTGVEELGLFDTCWGHPAPGGTYHYHIKPLCIFNITCNTPSTIIGVAFDGFPIYGPIDDDGSQLTTADLDECNGKITNGSYRYHITNDFPYFMGCYKGTPSRVRGECQCSKPVEVCTEFGRRSKRRTTVTTFDCCVEGVNCTYGYNDDAFIGGSRSNSHASATILCLTGMAILLIGFTADY